MLSNTNNIDTLHIIWVSGASCDGCTMAMLGAAEPSLEDLLLNRAADMPTIKLVHAVLALESGKGYLHYLEEASEGRLSPFVLVLEGSILDEALAGAGYFSRLGEPEDERPCTTGDWVSRLAPQAQVVVAIGSCATWGGIPAARGTPTGAMGLEQYLGADFTSRAGLPVINLPGCAPWGATFLETLRYICYHLAGLVPLELDEEHRPAWLYNRATLPIPPRLDYLPDIVYTETGRPSVMCPVPSRGWMRHIGGCARIGGACIGCTARDFADHYLEYARPHSK